MNAKIADLMSTQLISIAPHHTVGHARALLARNSISALPVLDSEGAPVGMFTTSDLARDIGDQTPVSATIGDKVYTVPQYGDVSLAARVMRNHGIHHLVVTHEQRAVGMISSFDLLRLVEDHRFVPKAAPTASPRKGGKRRKAESPK